MKKEMKEGTKEEKKKGKIPELYLDDSEEKDSR